MKEPAVISVITQISDDSLAPLDAVAGERLQLLVFGASWCGPCKAMAPVIEEIANVYAQDVAVAKIDIEQSPEIASAFQVRGVPTLLLRREQELDRHIGMLTRTRLSLMLDAALEKGDATA